MAYGKLRFEGEYLYNQRRKGKYYIINNLEYEGEYIYNKKWDGKGYDETNYKTYTDKFYYTKAKYNRPKTASEFALRNFSNYENNYLKLRKKRRNY